MPLIVNHHVQNYMKERGNSKYRVTSIPRVAFNYLHILYLNGDGLNQHYQHYLVKLADAISAIATGVKTGGQLGLFDVVGHGDKMLTDWNSLVAECRDNKVAVP